MLSLAYAMTSMPIDRAVPSMIRIAASRLAGVQVGQLGLRDLLDLRRVTLPTLLRFGSPEPFSIPAAFLSRIAAGGVLVMKV